MNRYELNAAWQEDYDRDHPSIEDCQIVKKIATNLRENLLPHLSDFFTDFEIHFVKRHRFNKWMGIYVSGSFEKPIVLLSIDEIHEACDEKWVAFSCGVETTIVHELGHAIQDLFSVTPEEDEAEDFASYWYHHRKVSKFWNTPEFSGEIVEMA